jgi:hypothetical protein
MLLCGLTNPVGLNSKRFLKDCTPSADGLFALVP